MRTPESRAKGLGGRSAPLKRDESMLFIFDEPETVSFWMKDTLIPLELALFDTKGMLSELFEMPVEPNPDKPEKRYTATRPALMGLELPPRTLNALGRAQPTLCVNTLAR